MRRHIFRAGAIAMLGFVITVLCVPTISAQSPNPDPAGIATGDRNNVQDAAGTPFVVPEPTDTKASDYTEKKKAFDEYKQQVASEPLAA